MTYQNNVNMQNLQGYTALMKAAENDHFKCLDTLIEGGADVNIQNYSSCTAVICAAQSHHVKCLELLTQAGADVNVQDVDGCTPLRYAVEKSDYRSVQLCIKAGAEINLVNNKGINPVTQHNLTWYLRRNQGKEIVRLLYAAGGKIFETKVKVPDYLEQLNVKPSEMSLLYMCREAIRKHMMSVCCVNLFYRVPKLGLPATLQKYLLYNVSLDD